MTTNPWSRARACKYCGVGRGEACFCPCPDAGNRLRKSLAAIRQGRIGRQSKAVRLVKKTRPV